MVPDIWTSVEYRFSLFNFLIYSVWSLSDPLDFLGLTISKRIFQLYGDKHEIYFLVNKFTAEKLRKKNAKIKFLIYSHPTMDVHQNDDQALVEEFVKFGEILRITDDRVKFVKELGAALFEMYDEAKLLYPEITKILSEFKPDRE